MDGRYFDLILLIPLVVLTISDIRHREVSVLWLAVFMAATVTVSLYVNGLGQSLQNTVFNLLILLYMTLGIAIYLRVRYKKWISPFNEHIGWGDIVFFGAVSPLFDTQGYIILLVVSSMAGFLAGVIIKHMMSDKAVTIPMISVVGIVLSTYLIYKDFFV